MKNISLIKVDNQSGRKSRILVSIVITLVRRSLSKQKIESSLSLAWGELGRG
jgi:hypothetical protein